MYHKFHMSYAYGYTICVYEHVYFSCFSTAGGGDDADANNTLIDYILFALNIEEPMTALRIRKYYHYSSI